jgi:hypothetical protein
MLRCLYQTRFEYEVAIEQNRILHFLSKMKYGIATLVIMAGSVIELVSSGL